MRRLAPSTAARWSGPPREAKLASVSDCMVLRLPDLPLSRPIGRLAWRWPDGDISGLVYRLGVDPLPHVVLAYGRIRQLVAFVPCAESGIIGRSFLCACSCRTQRLYLPRNGAAWRCKWCYRLTPAGDRHECRGRVNASARYVRWATIASRSRVAREQTRAPGAWLFGPAPEWSTMDAPPPLASWAGTIAPIHRF